MHIDDTSSASLMSADGIESTRAFLGGFRFDVFEVDACRGELRKRGSKIKLEDKPFQLLVLLLERAGKTTSREELCQGLWPLDTFVNFENSLKTAVSKVRYALGDSADNPKFIKTVQNQGYRFVAPVVNVEPEFIDFENGQTPPVTKSTQALPTSTSVIKFPHKFWRGLIAAALLLVVVIAALVFRLRRNPASTPIPSTQRVVLLILPFENLSGDPKQEYFGAGLTDEMITLLSRQYPKGLAVIARTSAMRYRGTQKPLQVIARELGTVNYVLEGTVRRSGNHVAINAQLFRSQDQTSLWAETYNIELGDLLATQQDVAERIARSLVLEVVPDRGSRATSLPAPDAHEAYLMGLYEANERSERSLRKSIEFFQTAIRDDPSYAPAYAELANSHLISAGWLLSKPEDAYPNAKAAALRALALDDNLAEAHTALAEEEHEYEWKWGEAEGEFRRAIELDPNSVTAHKSYGEFLMHGGRTDQAITEMERARELDPLSLIVNTLVGFAYHNARQYDRAVKQYKEVLQLDPTFAPAHYFLGASLVQTGHYDEAIAHLQTATKLTNAASLMTAGLARAYAVAGRRDSAQRMLHELTLRATSQYISPYGLAQVYAALGEKSAALRMLHLACTGHAFELMFLKVDRSFDNLHDDQDFQKLLKQIGFPEQDM